MRTARRRWWVVAILFALGCGVPLKARPQTGAGTVGSVGSGGSGGLIGTGGFVVSAASNGGAGGTLASSGESGGSGSASADSGGASGGGGMALCYRTFQPPAVSCTSPCLVELAKGGTPQVLYDRPSPTSYGLLSVLAVADDYVIASVFWGTQTWDEPDAQYGVVEIPRSGGQPVLVDSFDVDESTSILGTIEGGDGYLYYAAFGPSPSTSYGQLTLRRVSMTKLGDQATVLTMATISAPSILLAFDAGYLYVAMDMNISRIPAGGGSLEGIIGEAGFSTDGPLAIAVNGGFVYFNVVLDDGVTISVQRMPLVGLADPTTLATGDSFSADSLLAYGGSPASLYLANATVVRKYDADTSSSSAIFTSSVGRFSAMTFVGTTLYVSANCPDVHPDSGPVGSFVETYDTVTGLTGYLEEAPEYPFVVGPTGFAHDATAATLFFIE